MNAELISAFVLLFLVLDPLGNLPVVASLLKQVDSRRRALVVARECFIAYLILLAFMFGGRQFLDVMHLSEISLSIAGGVILFMIAINMVFKSTESVFGESLESEPFIVPLAIPGIAGPSTMAALLLLGHNEPARTLEWSLALVIAWAATGAILFSATMLYRVLGPRVITASERLMGMLLVAISVQMFLDGVAGYLKGAGAGS